MGQNSKLQFTSSETPNSAPCALPGFQNFCSIPAGHLIRSMLPWQFSIYSADFPRRDPAIPSPRSFHGVKICSVFLSTSQWVEIRIHNHFGPIVLAYVLARFVHLHSFHDFLFRLVIIHIGHTLKCHFYANLFSGFSVGPGKFSPKQNGSMHI